MTKGINLQGLIAEGEGQRLEFKEKFQNEAIEAICAFANADGGTILVGVSDEGQPLGVQVGRKTLEDWANQINAALDPRIKVNIETLSEVLSNQRQVLMITVPQSQTSAVSFRGKFFRRVGRTNQLMTGEDIAQKLIAANKLSWDSVIEDRATLDDIDPTACATLVRLLNKNGRRLVPDNIGIDSLLLKLGLMDNSGITRAAVLLLARNPQHFYPTALIKIGRFHSPTSIQDDREITGPLINQIEDAHSWFRERLATKLQVVGQTPARNTVWEYPIDAIREALANAICHRDYREQRHIQVRLFDSYVEFWNPGGLPASLSVQDLLKEHDSVPRNLKLAENLYNAGFVEKWGTGTIRMDELLRDQGLPSPEFFSDSMTFRLRFRKAYSIDYLINIGLNERQSQIIVEASLETRVTNQSYCLRFNVNKRTASRELSELLEKGFLRKHGSTGRGTYYTKS